MDIEAATGSMSLDGTLRRRFLCEESRELKLLGVRIELEHGIDTDAWGRARSVWRVPGLKSSLVPEGRGYLRWQRPAGPAVRFERAKIGRALAEAGATRWRIREDADGSYEIRSPDGHLWRYVRGRLVSATHPALGELRVTTQGSSIVSVWRADAGAADRPLLSVSYDATGKLRSWAMDDGDPHRLEYDESGQLQTWRRPDGTSLRFEYDDGLLSTIADERGTTERFTWRENPGHRRGDSRWAAPVHLASDGTNTYDYELTRRGFVLRRRENGSGREAVTILNPRRRRLEQRAGEDILIATFRGATLGRGALERIANGQGRVLEDYRYDTSGRLTVVRRAGEPERVLTYDESGRLMALEERAEP